MILPCDCKHKVQDSMYGEGKRVFNPKKTTLNKPQEYTCTICKRVRTGPTLTTSTKKQVLFQKSTYFFMSALPP